MAEEQGTSFGDLLRHYRALAGLSQIALASRTGISKEAVSMLERGVRARPRNATVLRLAQALRLRPEDRTALAAAARRAAATRAGAGCWCWTAWPRRPWSPCGAGCRPGCRATCW